MTVAENPQATPFDRKLVRLRRDRVAACAARGETPADFLLARVADDLVERLQVVTRRFDRVLILGAYGGLVGKRLRKALPEALVIEAELSPALARACDGPALAADEEALPFADGTLDLVISVLSLQAVNDLPGTLLQARRALKPDGLLLAAVAGGRTLIELREALLAAEIETTGGAAPRVAPMPEIRDLGALLQRAGFALPVTDSDCLTVTYPTALHLMHDLRAMAATNVLRDGASQPMRRATLQRTCEIYAERFGQADGRIPATFEILTLTGWVPHESQQTPLQPGSAKTRLAQALGTAERPAGDKVGS